MQPTKLEPEVGGEAQFLEVLGDSNAALFMQTRAWERFKFIPTASILQTRHYSSKSSSFNHAPRTITIALDANSTKLKVIPTEIEETQTDPATRVTRVDSSDVRGVRKFQHQVETLEHDIEMNAKRYKELLGQMENENRVLKRNLAEAESRWGKILELEARCERLEQSDADSSNHKGDGKRLRDDDQECLPIADPNAGYQQEVHLKMSELIRNGDEKVQRLKAEQAGTKRALANLQEEFAVQSGQLTACKDDLFRLRPSAQITDSEIAAEYNVLCENVVTWVINELTAFEDQNPETSEAVTCGSDVSWGGLMNRFPEIDEYLLGSTIHTNIQETLFGDKIMYVGILTAESKMLLQIEKDMAKLEPRKDSFAINGWRSDTLRAIASTPRTTSLRHKIIQDLEAALCAQLRTMFPTLSSKSLGRLCRDVITPAAALEHKIHLATGRYRFSNPKTSLTGDVAPKDMDGAVWIDIKTRKAVHPNGDMMATSRRGSIGEAILQYEPSLVRVGKGRKELMLHPAKYILELCGPEAKRTRTSR